MSDNPDDQALLAGEYVLGLLDAAQMRALEAQAATDPQIASDIAFWEDQFLPLASLVSPVPPPSVLWSRLALATGVGGAVAARSGAGLWKGTTALAVAVAAGFAFLAFLPRPPVPDAAGTQFVAALAPMNAAATFLAQARADGTIAITRLAAATAPAGRDVQLWALPKGATRPISLGVLGAGEPVVRPAERALAEEQLLVSDEPTGGSPTGQPTGAVLYGGTLTPLSSASTPGR